MTIVGLNRSVKATYNEQIMIGIKRRLSIRGSVIRLAFVQLALNIDSNIWLKNVSGLQNLPLFHTIQQREY